MNLSEPCMSCGPSDRKPKYCTTVLTAVPIQPFYAILIQPVACTALSNSLFLLRACLAKHPFPKPRKPQFPEGTPEAGKSGSITPATNYFQQSPQPY